MSFLEFLVTDLKPDGVEFLRVVFRMGSAIYALCHLVKQGVEGDYELSLKEEMFFIIILG